MLTYGRILVQVELKSKVSTPISSNNCSSLTIFLGDGVFYCDMRGTGADDYVVSADTTTDLRLYLEAFETR